MANKPRRFERGTVLYFVNYLGNIIRYKVVAQRLSAITVQCPKPVARRELPDGTFEPVIRKQKVDAKEVDWGFEWYSDERAAVTRSIRTMRGLLDYAEQLPNIIRAREELLAKLTDTLEKPDVQDLISLHVY
jgi:hypothetical protein